MESLPRGHPVMSKMHFRVKQSLYWLEINQDIIKWKSYMSSCRQVTTGGTSNSYRSPNQTLAKNRTSPIFL